MWILAPSEPVALRGTAESVCPQPELNATDLPSCAPISARAAQRQRRRRWWRGEKGERRPGPEGQVLRHVLWHVLRSVLRSVLGSVLRRILHVPDARTRAPTSPRSTGFCAIWGCISSSSSSLVLHVLVLHVFLHVSPKGKRGGGTLLLGVDSKAALAADRTSSGVGLASGSPRAAA